jgi:hypothetical protein
MLNKDKIVKTLLVLMEKELVGQELEDAAKGELAEFLGYTEAQQLFAKVLKDFFQSEQYKNREEILVSDIVKVKSRRDEYFLNNRLRKHKYRYELKGNASALFKAHKDIISSRLRICEIKYNPRQKSDFFSDDKHSYLNLYTPPFWMFKHFYYDETIPREEMPPAVSLFIRHLLPDEQNRNFVLDWSANSLKQKNQLFLVLIGRTGIGKGMLANLLGAVHGSAELNDAANYFEIQFKNYMGTKFNAYLENITLFFLDEIKIQDEDQENALKGLVNNTFAMEGKGRDQESKQLHCSLIMASNFQSAAKLDPDDRRYAFPDLGEEKITAFLAKHYNGMDPNSYWKNILFTRENVQGFAHYLWHRQITSNLYTPPQTKQSNKVRIASTKDEVRFLIEEYCVKNAGEVVLESDAKEAIFGYNKYKMSSEKFRLIERTFPGVFKVGQAKPTIPENYAATGRPLTLTILPLSEQRKHPFGVLDEE